VFAAGRGSREGSCFLGTERLGLDFAFLADERFDAGFGLFQLLAAGVAQTHALFEEFDRALQREIAGLQFFDDFFQFVEAGLEGEDGGGWCNGIGHEPIVTVDGGL